MEKEGRKGEKTAILIIPISPQFPLSPDRFYYDFEIAR